MGEGMKPCCWCGEAYINEIYHGNDPDEWFQPYCKCDVVCPDKQVAIEQWNKRPNHWITDRLPTDKEQGFDRGSKSFGVIIKLVNGGVMQGVYTDSKWETGGEGFPIKEEVYGWMLWPV